MAFELPPLPYDYDALEPTISRETMTFHHDKHHAAYTTNLNAGVAESEASMRSDAAEASEAKSGRMRRSQHAPRDGAKFGANRA